MEPKIIPNSILEGVQQLEFIVLLKFSKPKLIATIILSICSLGIVPVLLIQSIKLRKILYYSKASDISSATHVYVLNKSDKKDEIQNLDKHNMQYIYFVNRFIKYIYEQQTHSFYPQDSEVLDLTYNEIQQTYKGIQSDPRIIDYKRQKYGKCQMQIPPPQFLPFIIKQITSFQYFILYLGCVTVYLLGQHGMAFIFFLQGMQFPILNFIETKRYLKNIEKTLQNYSNIKVFRHQGENEQRQFGQNYEIHNTSELLPGDIFVFENYMKIPCDCVLLQGRLLINEASLTGESLPIPKQALDINSDQRLDLQNIPKSFIYEGTNILNVQNSNNPNSPYALGLVVRTGYTSFKGSIYRDILFPKEQEAPFYESYVKFLAILLVLGFFSFYPIYTTMVEKQFKSFEIFVAFLNTILNIVPPALPILIDASIYWGKYNLRKKDHIENKIPLQILQAAKVQSMFFDKTGTLTQQGIDMVGYSFSQDIQNSEVNSCDNDYQKSVYQQQLQFQIFATCHGVYQIDGQQMGDLLDLSMLKFSGWDMKQNKEMGQNSGLFTVELQNQKLTVLKTFEFESHLQRMGCIVKDDIFDKYYYFCKGAPEVIQNLVQNVPQNYKQFYENEALNGQRVIAMASKEIQSKDLSQSQQYFEQNMEFQGLIFFQNRLKPDTKEVIQKLLKGDIECRIVSGDNMLTCISAGRECVILDPDNQIIALDYINNATIQLQTIPSIQMKESHLVVQSGQKSMQFNSIEELCQNLNQYNMIHDQIFAITGRFFNFIEQNDHIHNSIIKQILKKTHIFSRMKPQQKALAIQFIQKQNTICGMIGDGTNDCAAIKQADVSIAFGGTDAGYSSGFNSEYGNDSIKVVFELLKRGKCVLQNSIDIIRLFVIQQIYQCIALYFTVNQCAQYSTPQGLAQIFFVNQLAVFQTGMMNPQEDLSPLPVNDNFLSFENVATFVGQLSIAFAASYSFYSTAISNPLFQPQNLNDKNLGFHLDGDANMTMYLGQTVIMIYSCISLIRTSPFKIPLQKVTKFVNLMIFVSVAQLCIFFNFGEFLINWLSLDTKLFRDFDFRMKILVSALNFGLLILIVELKVVKKFLGQYDITKYKFRNKQRGQDLNISIKQ